MVYLTVNNYTKILKGNTVLKNINLSLEKGKVYGFKGPNGSGKTMLFRAICGLIRPTEGKVVINDKILGKEISFPPSVGAIIEYPGFLPNYSGFDNLKLLAQIKGLISDEIIKETILKVGLNPDDKRKVKKYSLGMKQRLGIAQAIMEDPDLLILDEPTNALDQDGYEIFRKIVSEKKERGKTILLTSHDKEELTILSDIIFEMDRGSIILSEGHNEK